MKLHATYKARTWKVMSLIFFLTDATWLRLTAARIQTNNFLRLHVSIEI